MSSERSKMNASLILFILINSLVIVICQQPLDDLSEISSFVPTDNVERKLLRQCESFAQSLGEENEKLKNTIGMLKAKVDALEGMEEDEEDEEDEDEEKNYKSIESEERSTGIRQRRGTRCDGGTLSAWACAPQCIFKLKGLCGLSLKSLCHC